MNKVQKNFLAEKSLIKRIKNFTLNFLIAHCLANKIHGKISQKIFTH